MEPRARTLLGVPFCGGTITLAQTCNAVFAALLSLRLSMLARSGPSAKTRSPDLNGPKTRRAKRPGLRLCLERFLPFVLRARPAATRVPLSKKPAFLVPEITASEHCRVCSASARTMSGRLALSDC